MQGRGRGGGEGGREETCMNNHVHSAPQLERKKEKNREERKMTHYKINNNLNGLEKYSLILGEQPQQLRKINICTCACTLYMYLSIPVHV